MYTQTLYELSQELNACYSFLANSCSYWKNASLCTRRRRATTGFTLESA